MGPGPLLNAKVVPDIRSGRCHGHLGSLSTKKAQLVPSEIQSQPLAMLAAIGTPFTTCKTLAIKQGEHCDSDYFFFKPGGVCLGEGPSLGNCFCPQHTQTQSPW